MVREDRLPLKAASWEELTGDGSEALRMKVDISAVLHDLALILSSSRR
jgi:hypothetical protein